MSTLAAVIGRILLGLLFIVSGAHKLITVDDTNAAITAAGLPAGLAIPTGVFEVIAGLCLAVGLLTRLFAILLAGFVFLTVVFFHHTFDTFMDWMTVLEHFALIGGMLLVFAHSQMWWSWDRMRAVRTEEIARRDAELRAARAEGAAHALNPDAAPAPPRRRWWFS
ncbi:MAG: DoxX family protein [Novosphingobium sp.]|nr:DoxX family protein [Novosphingobium sp.]